MNTTRKNKRTLLVGLDAACWEYLAPLLENGEMPTLQRLMESGTSGTLHSTMPPWTPAAWATIATGKSPAQHGVCDMMWRRPGTYEFLPTNASVRRGTPFWQRLNEAGVRVGLVNVPFTYPPDAVDGFVVCGFGTPGSVTDLTHPPEALQWIETEFGSYEPAVSAEVLQSAPPAEILAVETEHQSRQVQIALGMAQRMAVDVLVINLMLPDHANHKVPTMAEVHEAYRRSDRDLNELLREFEPDNTLLISDHGSNRLKGNFLLGNWLQDHGYCTLRPNPPQAQAAAFNWVLMQWFQQKKEWHGLPEKIVRFLVRHGMPLLPGRLHKWFWAKLEEQVPFAQQHVLYSSQPDYAKTQLFPGSIYSGLLYLNVSGREPTGTISPEARRALAAEIAAELRTVREPDTGEPLFAHVHTVDELYPGHEEGLLPDLILDSYDCAWNIQSTPYVPRAEQTQQRYFAPLGNQRDYGWHSRDGIFVFSGIDFNIGTESYSGHLTDIAATLLHLYGVAVPDDYEGIVLADLLTPALAMMPVQQQAGDPGWMPKDERAPYTGDEQAELMEHLKALGYLA